MPKIKPLTEHEAEIRRLKSNLLKIQGHYTNDEMGKIIGKSGVTYAARLRDPETLDMREVRMICKHFKVDRAKFITEELKW